MKAVVSVGKPFDPRFHEAMQQVQTADLPPNHVVYELVRGFIEDLPAAGFQFFSRKWGQSAANPKLAGCGGGSSGSASSG